MQEPQNDIRIDSFPPPPVYESRKRIGTPVSFVKNRVDSFTSKLMKISPMNAQAEHQIDEECNEEQSESSESAGDVNNLSMMSKL